MFITRFRHSRQNVGVRSFMKPARQTRSTSRFRISRRTSRSYSSLSGKSRGLTKAVSRPRSRARWRPAALSRLLRTRTISASIRPSRTASWIFMKFEPRPEMRTAIRPRFRGLTKISPDTELTPP